MPQLTSYVPGFVNGTLNWPPGCCRPPFRFTPSPLTVMLCAVRSSFANTTTWPLLTVSSVLLNCRPFCVTVIGAAAGTLAASAIRVSEANAMTGFMVCFVGRALLRKDGDHCRRIGARQCVEKGEQVGFVLRAESQR